ncbi:phosphotransferase [Rhizobium ruizarguesonis]|uniref:phosphotransferase n=1 Tax=Rhizobium ruizarguesonis TaxID=2081791 RepID=UPI00102F5DEC|nr:phosphotransferase [Rhizobium ruizarguesonis]
MDELVDGGVVVVSDRSRHAISAVVAPRSGGFLVKQGITAQPDSAASLAREARFYRSMYQQNGEEMLQFLPAFHRFDEFRGLLVIEYVSDAENLKVFYERTGSFPVELGRHLGLALATLHFKTNFGRLAEDEPFLSAAPWILSLHKQIKNMPYGVSGANSQLSDILAGHGSLARAFDELYETWPSTVLIHGDMKWENCLVSLRSSVEIEPIVKLIDWETASYGDRCWDVGSLFQSFMGAWVFAVSTTQDIHIGRSLPSEENQLDILRPAIRAFWRGYIDTAQLTGAQADEFLTRSMRYAAVRLVQTVYEHNVGSNAMIPALISTLQLALNILANPEGAIASLLKMSSEHAND